MGDVHGVCEMSCVIFIRSTDIKNPKALLQTFRKPFEGDISDRRKRDFTRRAGLLEGFDRTPCFDPIKTDSHEAPREPLDILGMADQCDSLFGHHVGTDGRAEERAGSRPERSREVSRTECLPVAHVHHDATVILKITGRAFCW